MASTLAYVALYAGLRSVSSAAAANAMALVVTAVANTAANRRLTFEVQGRDGLARDHVAGLLALAAALAITSAAPAMDKYRVEMCLAFLLLLTIGNLRGMSQGRAQFTMQYDHYEPVLQHVADEVIKKYA